MHVKYMIAVELKQVLDTVEKNMLGEYKVISLTLGSLHTIHIVVRKHRQSCRVVCSKGVFTSA